VAANRYERGEVFRRSQHRNADGILGIDSAGENLSVKSDSQANQRNQTEVLPATTTLQRKAALSEQTNVPQNKSAKRPNRKKPPKVKTGTPERVQLLLKYQTSLNVKYIHLVMFFFSFKLFFHLEYKVTRDRVIAFWTSPRVPGVACEDKYFFTTVGEVPRFPGVPCFHVIRPLVTR